MNRHYIYTPQPNASPDEVLQVLKMFTVMSLPPALQEEMYNNVYEKLPETAKRHFKVQETP
jgi:hypothetical protein